MSNTSRTAEHRNARYIAGSAIDSSRRRVRLKRCRALLRELDPEARAEGDDALEDDG